MEEDIRNMLTSLGFGKNEADIYLTLIANPHSSALEISRLAKIHRSNTYDSLRQLIDKGFVKKSVDEDRSIFTAMPPETIVEYIHQKEKDFEAMLPRLKDMGSPQNEDEEISISHGRMALRTVTEELLTKKEPILVYGASKETITNLGEGYLEGFHKRRISKKISMKHIYNTSVKERMKYLKKLPYTEARALPKKYDTNVCTTICDDSVYFFLFSTPILVISIKNKSIAETYKRYFDLLWKRAESTKIKV